MRVVSSSFESRVFRCYLDAVRELCLSPLVLKDDNRCCESRSFFLARSSVMVGQSTYPSTDRRSLDPWLVVFLAGLCRYGCLRPFSPLVVLCLMDNEEYSLARSSITSYFRRRLGDSGIREPPQEVAVSISIEDDDAVPAICSSAIVIPGEDDM
ncbi:unnamed protein product [Eruca vesicaria subsp. sativa]|uniref:Uncharacterized protein n=1 Tax=Eruca vesicaria subsp. sativa TaxID=29727 RepID=A0ABC8IWJ6_ERUVS|nr:unnamed protein product [Eruca vesicaria subsp. sativa]